METTNIDSRAATRQFASFQEFYPYYLEQHSNRNCRRMHFVGTSVSLACALLAVVTVNVVWAFVGVLSAYTCAWIGHFLFEKNKPASWQHFRYSFAGDWVMFGQMLRGRIPA